MSFDVLKYNALSVEPISIQSTNNCVIGLDRDGIINQIPSRGYVKTPDDLVIIPGALEAIKSMRDRGYQVSIISDQPQITKGNLSTWEVDAVNMKLMEIFGQAGIMSIQGLYYNTSEDKQDMYSKLNLGMFRRCESENPTVDFSKGYYVGDNLVDLKAAIKLKAKPVLIRTGNGNETEVLLNKFTNQEVKKKARIYSSLLEFSSDLP